MSEFNVNELEDKDLHDIVEEGNYVEKFLPSKMGEILFNACNRKAEEASRQIAYHSKPTDVAETTMLHTKLRFFKYEIHALFKSIVNEGEIAQQEIDLRKEDHEEPTSE